MNWFLLTDLNSGKHGFTLAELIIAIAILALTAALVIPRFSGAAERGRISEAVANLNLIRQGELEYSIDNNGIYSATSTPALSSEWVNIGIADPNAPANRFFDYDVSLPAGGGFLARATRNMLPTSNTNFDGQTICYNNNGTWSGDHPLAPRNANGAGCPAGEPCCP